MTIEGWPKLIFGGCFAKLVVYGYLSSSRQSVSVQTVQVTMKYCQQFELCKKLSTFGRILKCVRPVRWQSRFSPAKMTLHDAAVENAHKNIAKFFHDYIYHHFKNWSLPFRTFCSSFSLFYGASNEVRYYDFLNFYLLHSKFDKMVGKNHTIDFKGSLKIFKNVSMFLHAFEFWQFSREKGILTCPLSTYCKIILKKKKLTTGKVEASRFKMSSKSLRDIFSQSYISWNCRQTFIFHS